MPKPIPYIVIGEGGHAYFRMTPGYEKGLKGAHGQAYAVGRTPADDELLWESKGWYTFEAYLSPRGHHLVRMHKPWSKLPPSDDQLAVSFYKDGVLLAEYSTLDLTEDVSSMPRKGGRYLFRDWDSPIGFGPRSYSPEWFRFSTADGVEHRFDHRTGKRLEAPREPQR